MGFWNLKVPAGNIAMIEPNGKVITYGELQYKVDQFKGKIFSYKKSLGLILCENSIDTVIVYLAALQKEDAVILVDQAMNESLLKKIVDVYSPHWIYSHQPIGGISKYVKNADNLYFAKDQTGIKIYNNTAVLLATSGTTGSVKFVRLSYENLQSNAVSIAKYLELHEGERPILTLPMQYSYGLSVINSHLEVGACLLMTNDSILSKSFWEFFKSGEATSFAGVPYTYEMLKRLRFERMDLPSLKAFTQAGGRLSKELVAHFHGVAKEKRQRFFVMYGQTEATARMSYVPTELLHEKLGSIGISIPDGELFVDEKTTELIYKGQNVMLGYADNKDDLQKGDECNGVLHTGDLATVDGDGYFSIIGRKKRFIKLFGLRISLDEVERALEQQFSISVACTGNDEALIVAIEDDGLVLMIKEKLTSHYGLHHRAFKIKVVEQIPRLGNGKINYEVIKDL